MAQGRDNFSSNLAVYVTSKDAYRGIKELHHKYFYGPQQKLKAE